MWWKRPVHQPFERLFPPNILEVIVRCYAIVEVGGFRAPGLRRGRGFERLFYRLCDRHKVDLIERAGQSSMVGQRSASGLRHEVDGAGHHGWCITDWELKYLSVPLSKNDLLIFNGKALDFLQATAQGFARRQLLRFLLSGGTVSPEARRFAALWGIMLIDRQLFPLPLIYEGLARGLLPSNTHVAIMLAANKVRWACRPLQTVISELADWSTSSQSMLSCGQTAVRLASESLAFQERLGAEMLNILDQHFPEWIDDLAESTWKEVGGW